MWLQKEAVLRMTAASKKSGPTRESRLQAPIEGWKKQTQWNTEHKTCGAYPRRSRGEVEKRLELGLRKVAEDSPEENDRGVKCTKAITIAGMGLPIFNADVAWTEASENEGEGGVITRMVAPPWPRINPSNSTGNRMLRMGEGMTEERPARKSAAADNAEE